MQRIHHQPARLRARPIDTTTTPVRWLSTARTSESVTASMASKASGTTVITWALSRACALCDERSCPSATRSRNAPASRSSEAAVGPPMLPEVAKTAAASARWGDCRRGRVVASGCRPITAVETVAPRPSACRTSWNRSASTGSVGSMLIRAERKVVPARSERASASHHSATAPGEMVAPAIRL